MIKKGMDYKMAGVDIDAGNEAVKLIKKDVESTYRPEVISPLGGFAGMFALDTQKYRHPVLVSSTDGVGTKLKIAFELDMHHTVGIDLVAMCVNDVLVTGAEPLFFLDYLATEKVYPEKIKNIVSGIVDGCKQAECALLGGETAEMPGFYQQDEYDLAGFVVGVVDKDKIIDGTTIAANDVVVGLPSTGLHSNGFTLARKILEKYNIPFSRYSDEMQKTWGEALMEPTKIYVKTVLSILEKYNVKGMANITGGGLLENLLRCLPKKHGINLDINSWDRHIIFDLLAKLGNVEQEEMFRTFNMGIGYCLIMSEEEAESLLSENTSAKIIGKVIKGKEQVICQYL